MRHRKSLDRDNKVLKIINKYNDCSILELLHKCIEEYPIFEWNYYNIRNSITRLYCNGYIEFDKKNANLKMKVDNKYYNRNRDVKIIKVKNVECDNEFLLGGFYE